METFTDLTLLAAIIPVIVGIVEVLKKFITDTRWSPLLSMAVGILLAFLFDLARSDHFLSANAPENVIAGLLAGLAASGLYSGVPALAGRNG